MTADVLQARFPQAKPNRATKAHGGCLSTLNHAPRAGLRFSGQHRQSARRSQPEQRRHNVYVDQHRAIAQSPSVPAPAPSVHLDKSQRGSQKRVASVDTTERRSEGVDAGCGVSQVKPSVLWVLLLHHLGRRGSGSAVGLFAFVVNVGRQKAPAAMSLVSNLPCRS